MAPHAGIAPVTEPNPTARVSRGDAPIGWTAGRRWRSGEGGQGAACSKCTVASGDAPALAGTTAVGGGASPELRYVRERREQEREFFF
jgi:hypothetical protein